MVLMVHLVITGATNAGITLVKAPFALRRGGAPLASPYAFLLYRSGANLGVIYEMRRKLKTKELSVPAWRNW